MNILPLISAFILFFALGSYALVHEWKASLIEKRFVAAAFGISRQKVSDQQEEAYNNCPGNNLFPQNGRESKKNEEAKFQSHRDKGVHPLGKLNIAPLFKDNPHPLLKEIALKYLKRIYERTDIYFDNLEKKMLDLIIKLAKDDPSINSFEAIYAKLERENPTFYKLIKGTHDYRVCTSRGYPALDDYFCIEHEWKRPVFFQKAPQILLEVVFGEAFADTIRRAEKARWDKNHKTMSLTKKALDKLMLKERLNPLDYEKFFYFGLKPAPKSQKTYREKGITLKL